MKNNFVGRKQKRWILCLMLIVAMALLAVGCGKEKQNEAGQASEKVETTDQKKVLGEGKTVFNFSVVDEDGKETSFEIHTDKKTVGEALAENDLIEGEEGEFGLYVKKVNGISADYDKDGAYWAFYEDGQYAATGVDVTSVKEGGNYAFRVEKE